MTYLSSFQCPYCKKRHYEHSTFTDDGLCLHCGTNMHTGIKHVETPPKEKEVKND